MEKSSSAKLESAKGDSVVFKSDMAGEITVAWSKIQELRTSHPFAVIGKKVTLAKHADVSQVPQGNVTMTDQKIAVEAAAGAPRTVPVADAGFVLPQPDFEKAMNHNAGFLNDWSGTVTAGASLVEATQNAETFTGGIALMRTEPTESWLNPSNRTLLDFTAAYGKISQPGVPDIKTAIYHAGAEEDKYFSARLFGFGQAAFDHNFSQGLDLQQSYGGGLGWTAYKTAAGRAGCQGARSLISTRASRRHGQAKAWWGPPSAKSTLSNFTMASCSTSRSPLLRRSTTPAPISGPAAWA